MMVCVLIRPELLKEHKTGSFMRSHPKHWSRIIQSYTIPLTHIKWEGEEVRKLVLLQVTNSSPVSHLSNAHIYFISKK